MARQVGIHQIKGRYGTTSYYFRKRAKSGFLRSINQELSERVKTADNYAGTRIQNEDFKQAMACSWCITSGWDTLKKFYLHSDMSARLAAFFRQYYVPYIGSESTEAQQARYLPRLANFLNVSQKNYSSALASIEWKTSVVYLANPSAGTYTLSLSLSFVNSSTSVRDFEKLFGADAVVTLRALSIDFNGKQVPQFSFCRALSFNEIFAKGEGLEKEITGSLLSPHIGWDSPLSSVLFVCEVVPVNNGQPFISRSSCVTVLDYAR